ncbi:MAG: DinB family protein [Candidatus Eisenbacteria bacterium]
MAVVHAKSEIETYCTTFELESQTTLKVLRAFPEARAEFKPVESSQSARELAWTLVMLEGCLEPILRGDAMMKEMPPMPPTWAGIMTAFEEAQRRTSANLDELSEAKMNATVRTMTGPKQEGEVRVGQLLWSMLDMTIHHRGQFSVYLRMVGGKVPSIYGPSGDEPW